MSNKKYCSQIIEKAYLAWCMRSLLRSVPGKVEWDSALRIIRWASGAKSTPHSTNRHDCCCFTYPSVLKVKLMHAEVKTPLPVACQKHAVVSSRLQPGHNTHIFCLPLYWCATCSRLFFHLYSAQFSSRSLLKWKKTLSQVVASCHQKSDMPVSWKCHTCCA